MLTPIRDPVASTTPREVLARGPRSALGADLIVRHLPDLQKSFQHPPQMRPRAMGAYFDFGHRPVGQLRDFGDRKAFHVEQRQDHPVFRTQTRQKLNRQIARYQRILDVAPRRAKSADDFVTFPLANIAEGLFGATPGPAQLVVTGIYGYLREPRFE